MSLVSFEANRNLDALLLLRPFSLGREDSAGESWEHTPASAVWQILLVGSPRPLYVLASLGLGILPGLQELLCTHLFNTLVAFS